MKRIILNLILVPVMMLLPAVALTAPVYAYAPCSPNQSSAAQQVSGGIGQTGPNPCNDNGVTKAIKLAVQILSFVVGAVSVIAIIWSGFKYVTSGGDANKVANAKNTLIYALVGLAVAVLAQLIVNTVITQANKIS